MFKMKNSIDEKLYITINLDDNKEEQINTQGKGKQNEDFVEEFSNNVGNITDIFASYTVSNIEGCVKKQSSNVDKGTKESSSKQKVKNKESDNKGFKESENEKVNKTNVDYDIYKKLLERAQFRVHQDDVYLYINQYGYFKKLTPSELKVIIRKGWPEWIERQLTKYKVDDVIDRLKGSHVLQINSDSFDKYTGLVNFENYVLDVNNGDLYEHSPKFNFKSYIKANYYTNMNKNRGETFRGFINQCIEGDEDKGKLLQEICGYVISNFFNAKKFFVFIGKPHTGKSTLLDLLKEIIGSEYTSAIPLHKLGDRFMTANLFEAKLNISGELNEGELKGLNTIKALTGNDDIIGERKGRDPFVFKNKAKLVFAGNQMPLLKNLDSTSAFFDRIIFVTFNNTIPEHKRDLELKEKMLREKDYIVYWAIKGLKRLIKNNFIFTTCKSSTDFKNKYVEEVNTVISFIQQCCLLDRNDYRLRIHKKDLYHSYYQYCTNNCLGAVGKLEFFNQINGLSLEKKKFRYNKSTPLEGYLGITLKDRIEKDF